MHKKKTAYNVPDWVKEQWKTRDQNFMAQLLMDANWSKDRIYILVLPFPYVFKCVFDSYILRIANLSTQEKFIDQLELVVKKKNTQKVWVDEQWLTEKEMKDDLKWSTILDPVYTNT